MNNLKYKIASLMRRVAELEEAQSAETDFFDNPTKRSVRNFAESKAISNRVDTTEKAIENTEIKRDKKLLESEALVAPPTPEEIVKNPGGEEFRTLNQFIVKTEEPVKGVPKSREEIPKAKPLTKNLSNQEIKQDLINKVVERHTNKKDKVKAVKKVLQDRME